MTSFFSKLISVSIAWKWYDCWSWQYLFCLLFHRRIENGVFGKFCDKCKTEFRDRHYDYACNIMRMGFEKHCDGDTFHNVRNCQDFTNQAKLTLAKNNSEGKE